MKIETFKCDNCGRDRDKDTNHWSHVVGICRNNEKFILMGPLGNTAYVGFDISQLPAECGEEDYLTTSVDACGDDCRFSLASRFLATGSFEKGVVQQ